MERIENAMHGASLLRVSYAYGFEYFENKYTDLKPFDLLQ